MMFAEREFQQEQKRRQFEAIREKKKEETIKQSAMKAEQMKKIFEDSQKIEQMKKDQMIKAMEEAAKRQQILAIETEKQIEWKKKLSKDKQQYQAKILIQQKENEEKQIEQLLSARSMKEQKLA